MARGQGVLGSAGSNRDWYVVFKRDGKKVGELGPYVAARGALADAKTMVIQKRKAAGLDGPEGAPIQRMIKKDTRAEIGYLYEDEESGSTFEARVTPKIAMRGKAETRVSNPRGKRLKWGKLPKRSDLHTYGPAISRSGRGMRGEVKRARSTYAKRDTAGLAPVMIEEQNLRRELRKLREEALRLLPTLTGYARYDLKEVIPEGGAVSERSYRQADQLRSMRDELKAALSKHRRSNPRGRMNPKMLGREEFDRIYWKGLADTVPASTRREFYSDYRESGQGIKGYIRSTSSSADEDWSRRARKSNPSRGKHAPKGAGGRASHWYYVAVLQDNDRYDAKTGTVVERREAGSSLGGAKTLAKSMLKAAGKGYVDIWRETRSYYSPDSHQARVYPGVPYAVTHRENYTSVGMSDIRGRGRR
jgi:hypothetical protein